MDEHDELVEEQQEPSDADQSAETEDLEGVEEAAPESEGEQAPPLIDLNTATEKELHQLPGIGSALAARIVSQREEVGPYKEPGEITSVPGVSTAMFERIADQVTASPVEAPEDAEDLEAEPLAELDEIPVPEVEEEMPDVDVDSIPEWEPDLGELVEDGYSEYDPELEEFAIVPEPAFEDEAVPDVPEGEGVVSESEEKGPIDFEVAPVRVISESKPGWGRLLFIGLLSALLGAAAALLILYGVNGTLDFQSASSRALRAEAYRLDGELGTIDGQIGQLEVRLNAMQDLAPAIEEAQADIQNLSRDLAAAEATLGSVVDDLAAAQASLSTLEGSVTGLEKQMGSVTDDLGTLQAQVGDLEEQVASMDEELQALSKAAERFGSFLDGLRELLGESDDTVAPTRTPWVTLTSQPEVTVIPLATSTPTR